MQRNNFNIWIPLDHQNHLFIYLFLNVCFEEALFTFLINKHL